MKRARATSSIAHRALAAEAAYTVPNEIASYYEQVKAVRDAGTIPRDTHIKLDAACRRRCHGQLPDSSDAGCRELPIGCIKDIKFTRQPAAAPAGIIREPKQKMSESGADIRIKATGLLPLAENL